MNPRKELLWSLWVWPESDGEEFSQALRFPPKRNSRAFVNANLENLNSTGRKRKEID